MNKDAWRSPKSQQKLLTGDNTSSQEFVSLSEAPWWPSWVFKTWVLILPAVCLAGSISSILKPWRCWKQRVNCAVLDNICMHCRVFTSFFAHIFVQFMSLFLYLLALRLEQCLLAPENCILTISRKELRNATPLCTYRLEFRGRTHSTRRQRRRTTTGGSALVGLHRLCHPPPDHHSLPGCALEVPLPPATPHPGEPAVCLGAPQHSGCAQARQHQQWQQRLGPQRRRLSSAAFRKHVVSSLRACELWLWATCVHSSGNNAPESHQCLL